jgi:choline dehydrogenase-like flavoprotein
MFHFYTSVNGFWPRRLHGQRGRTNSHAFADFRGVEPGGRVPRVFRESGTPVVALGGVCDFNLSQGLVITNDGDVFTRQLPRGFGRRYGIGLKNALRDGALSQHLLSLSMVGEDAPQPTNRVDLDPSVRDVFGRPVARVTYRNHAFELAAREFYLPHMRRVLENAGLERIFTQPCDALFGDPPVSRHVMGTLRMGTDPATSVVDAGGRFHDVENLYACDGAVFPTSSGFNPTMTIIAVAAKIAHGMG